MTLAEERLAGGLARIVVPPYGGGPKARAVRAR